MKTITFRYFDVDHTGLTSSSSLVNRIIDKLSSAASDRMMPINKNNSDKFDLISNYFCTTDKKIIAGTCIRITDSKVVPVIKNTILSQPQFSISTINENANDDEKTCLDYFYFCLTDKNLIITLDPRGGGVTRFETYIKWLLNTNVSDEGISFTPSIDDNSISISDLKRITIGDSFRFAPSDDLKGTESGVQSTVVNLATNVLKQLLSDTSSLSDLMADNICSADLVIKFSKPRGMDNDEYKRKTAGAILKPLVDPDGIKFATNGKKIKGSEVLRTEEVEVDEDKGIVSEQNVYQELIKRINALK